MLIIWMMSNEICSSQVFTIANCDTSYSYQYYYFKESTNEDSLSCPLKAGLPRGLYIVIDPITNDTIITGEIDSNRQKVGVWKVYGAGQYLREQYLYVNGKRLVSMYYDDYYSKNMNLQIRPEGSDIAGLCLFYDFSFQWNLLKCGLLLSDSKVIEYALDEPMNIESWRSIERHGLWIQFKNGIGATVSYYDRDLLLYKIEL